MKSMMMLLRAMGSEEKHNNAPVHELKAPPYISFKPTPDVAAET